MWLFIGIGFIAGIIVESALLAWGFVKAVKSINDLNRCDPSDDFHSLSNDKYGMYIPPMVN